VKQSLYRYLRFRNQPKSTRSIDTYEIRFLELCSGGNIEAITPESNAYLTHLRSLADGKWTGELDVLVHADYMLLGEPFEKAIQLCSEVADLLRDFRGGHRPP
jgi:hypothetical protein